MAPSLFGRRRRVAAAVPLAVALLLTGCSGAASSGAADASGDQLLTIPREDMGTFTRNFNPFSPNVAPMTQQAIYEPMFVYNPADGSTTPWLATEWTTAEDGLSVTFTLRSGVRWSDGEPFTAEDVAFTFPLQKELLGGYEYLESVEATDERTVTFTLNRPFSPALFELGKQVIIPRHVWEDVADPAKDTNPEPVGTGPYTEVANFQSQSFELMPNPNYWQPEKQRIAGIRMLAFAGNTGANLAATNGEVDWAPQFIPNIQESYVAHDPEHRHYWFPPTGAMINWHMNTTKAPFDDPAVRKALSQAIDRETIVEVGMNGYTEPADCTGLSGGYELWRDQSLVDSCDWTTFDAEAAGKALDEAGYPMGPDGTRTMPNGEPFAFDISVGSSSSDWLSVANIISQNLAEIGVTANVDSPDWPAVSADYENGTFDTGIVWSGNGPTPYEFYRDSMGTERVKPVGERALENYHRYGTEEADRLLAQFAATSDEAEQRAVVNDLQALFAEHAPVVPLFPGPEWGAYTDVRFTGWPTAENPYATLSARASTTVLVLTSLTPVTG
ncbi:ABC transporter substrate-binding protein [Allostreptomyces psammosilenae]|uniref:Peptide/nickel transport system substrate-binding protein n=1 Tax=Allostreptomyces psammosilenae TaxID=1892865 RepID=A0A853A064_9ACTN|nr:ABC transporter substrate-binding protein [Allostreptomyces psammosilenae]NYI03778.1 peptide/nickel transport system substrate-binding protein [Allostreptomyces psammosilenae]